MNTAAVENVDRLELLGKVREALRDLMDIERYSWDERGVLTLRGRLSGPPESLYRAIRARLEALGLTPFLRRSGEEDELLALPGVVERGPSRLWLPIALFVATIFTVLLTGALNERSESIDSITALVQVEVALLSSPAALLAGLPFAATLLAILFTHEMGHYIVGRLRQAPVSLPYFVPMPPGLTLFGTLGAVIVQREPMEDRRTILEVGIAGPLAGLVIAIPLLLYGLATSPVGPQPQSYLQEGNSLLYAGAKWLMYGRYLPSNGQDVQLNPVAWGAWIGLLVTMLNMLPIGQLDGGHVAYALLGRRADYVAYGTIAICLALGLLVSSSWLLLPLLALVIGPRHPEPLNDISRLDRSHAALAIFGLIVFVLLFMPAPITLVGP